MNSELFVGIYIFDGKCVGMKGRHRNRSAEVFTFWYLLFSNVFLMTVLIINNMYIMYHVSFKFLNLFKRHGQEYYILFGKILNGNYKYQYQ